MKENVWTCSECILAAEHMTVYSSYITLIGMHELHG